MKSNNKFKKIKILIMGLPGSGKTTLSKKIAKELKAYWLNADTIRGKYKDWDFTKSGITRQVKRMKRLADKSKKKYVIADFVCPYHKQIKIFDPKIIIWMDTIRKSRFPDMNKKFKKPKKFNLRLKEKNLKKNFYRTKKVIYNYFNDHIKTSKQSILGLRP